VATRRRCLKDNMSSDAQLGAILQCTGTATDSVPEALTQANGGPSSTRNFFKSIHGARLPCKGETTYFFVAAVEAAYMHQGLWSSSGPGDRGDMSIFPGYKVRKAKSPRAV
jgi:hypothetical protein